MTKVRSSVRAWLLLAALALAPLAAVAVTQLAEQSSAVLVAGTNNGGSGGG